MGPSSDPLSGVKGVDERDWTRERLLVGFFRRREEAGKRYCAACLVEQLRQRGSPAFSLASVQVAVQDAFERPESLRVAPHGPCDACTQPLPSIGAVSLP